MRVLICGSRDYNDIDEVETVLNFVKYVSDVVEKKPLEIIEGGAMGADAIARNWARKNKIPCHTYHADWDRHGKAAGPIRNKQMLDSKPDTVIAFPKDGKLNESKGTKNMVDQSEAAGIYTVIVGGGKRDATP